MRIDRIFFVIITLGWTFGAYVGFTDPHVTSSAAKLTILITATGCWGVIASWNRSEPGAVATGFPSEESKQQ